MYHKILSYSSQEFSFDTIYLDAAKAAVPLSQYIGDHSTVTRIHTDTFLGRVTKKGYQKLGMGIEKLSDSSILTGNYYYDRLEGIAQVEHEPGLVVPRSYVHGELNWNNKEDFLLKALGMPHFVGLLTGNSSGSEQHYPLHTIAAHLKSCSPQNSDLSQSLRTAGELSVLSAENMKKVIIKKLETQDTILLPYGHKSHSMLLELSFNGQKLTTNLYNSGHGLIEYHTAHPVKENKYKTCKTVVFEKSSKSSVLFSKNLDHWVQYKTHSLEEAYQPFFRGTEIRDNQSEFQSSQKGGNCPLECVMSFLKKKLPAYKAYRLKLIQDTLAEFRKYNFSLDEYTHRDSLETRLLKMIDHRTTLPTSMVKEQIKHFEKNHKNRQQ